MGPALLLAALLAVTASPVWAADPATPGRAAVPPTIDTTKQADAAKFARKAVAGGLAEVALSRIALTNSDNAQVKTFANRMVTDHTAGEAELRRAAAAEKIGDLPEAPDEVARQHMARLAKLKGSEFDREYADRMVDDHEDTVDLFEEYAEDGPDGALKQTAAKLLPTLRDHLAQAKAMEDKLAGR